MRFPQQLPHAHPLHPASASRLFDDLSRFVDALWLLYEEPFVAEAIQSDFPEIQNIDESAPDEIPL
jgi:hypothetical protein